MKLRPLRLSSECHRRAFAAATALLLLFGGYSVSFAQQTAVTGNDEEGLAEKEYDPTASLTQFKIQDIYTPAEYGTNAQLNTLQIKLAEAKTDAERGPIQSQILSVQASQNAGYQRMDEEKISEKYTAQADYYYLHGNLLFKKKACQEALDQYLKAVEIDPKHGNSYNNIANLYYLGKQYDKAEEYLDKAEANGAKVNPAFKQALAKALNK
jgi:tetratricopeptide (TPR) repeat protein